MEKISVPYNIVAKDALMNWNGLSEEEANKVINESTFDEIESQVGAVGSMTYAVDAIVDKLDLTSEEKKEFSDAVFGRTDDQLALLKVGKRVAMSMNSENTLASIVTDVIEAVHNGWVSNNASLFFTKKQTRGQQYQYLPIELIGWDEAKSDLLFIKPIIDSMNLGVVFSEEQVRMELENRTFEFFDRNNVSSFSALGDSIQNMSYSPWTPEIEASMHDKSFVEGTILPELKEKGFAKDAQLMSKLEAKNLVEASNVSTIESTLSNNNAASK